MFQKKYLNKEGFHVIIEVRELPFECTGFLVIKSLKNNICTGGLRITDSVTLDEVCELAKCMDLKFSSYDLKVGGAKSGIRIPKNFNETQRTEILFAFAKSIENELLNYYFTGTDLGSTNSDIAKIYKSIGVNQMVLSKRLLSKTSMKSILFYIPDFILRLAPVGYSKYGGLLTAKGIVLALDTFVEIVEESESDNIVSREKTVAIHGVGEVGRNILEVLNDENYKVKAICDIEKSLIFKKAINTIEAKKMISSDGKIKVNNEIKNSNIEISHPDEILNEKIDVLILASRADVINSKNYQNINCSYILEGANNGIDPGIAETLRVNKKIHTLPDFFINSAIACSFGLMVDNKVSPYRESKFIKQTLSYMKNKMTEVFKISVVKNKSIRTTLTL